MKRVLGVAILLFGSLSTSVLADDLGMSFDDAAYVTCRDTQAMPENKRIPFAVALVKRASAFYGVPYQEGGDLDGQLGPLIRSGCTLFPDAYLHNITAAAFRRATNATPPEISPTPPIPFDRAAFLTCEQYGRMTDAQQDAVEYDFAVRAGNRYGMKFDDTEDGRARLDDGVTPLVYGACNLAPSFHVYFVVARAVQAAIEVQGNKSE